MPGAREKRAVGPKRGCDGLGWARDGGELVGEAGLWLTCATLLFFSGLFAICKSIESALGLCRFLYKTQRVKINKSSIGLFVLVACVDGPGFGSVS